MKNIINIFLLFLLSIFLNNKSIALSSNWDYSENSKVRIISSYDTILDQKELYLGLHFKLEPDWKIYWKHPGDSGLPPKDKSTAPKKKVAPQETR